MAQLVIFDVVSFTNKVYVPDMLARGKATRTFSADTEASSADTGTFSDDMGTFSADAGIFC